nr:hypothetical protein [Tanacetum cinerariifolium]
DGGNTSCGPQCGKFSGSWIRHRMTGAAQVAQPCPERTENRRTGVIASLMPGEGVEPALRNLLRSVHRDLCKAVVQGRIGEPIDEGIGVAAEILAGHGVDARRCLKPHQRIDDRRDDRIADRLVNEA